MGFNIWAMHPWYTHSLNIETCTACTDVCRVHDMSRIDYRNQTTIVTGASSGLGAEFARQLAARGSNLVLVARRADRLESLAQELTRAHGVTVTVIARDLGLPDAGRTLRAELESRGIHASGLVNNAGFGTHDAFTDEDPERRQTMIGLKY